MFCFLILAEPSWKDYGNHGGKWTSRSYPIILGEAVMKAVLIPLKSQKLVKPRKKGKVKKKKKGKVQDRTHCKSIDFHQDPRNKSETAKTVSSQGSEQNLYV